MGNEPSEKAIVKARRWLLLFVARDNHRVSQDVKELATLLDAFAAEARLEENEACAKLAEETIHSDYIGASCGRGLANAIRERAAKEQP